MYKPDALGSVKLIRSSYAPPDKSWIFGHERAVSLTYGVDFRKLLHLESVYAPGLDGGKIVGYIDHEKGEMFLLENVDIDTVVGTGSNIDWLEHYLTPEPVAPPVITEEKR